MLLNLTRITQIHDNLGVVLIQLGRINEAIDHFNKALAIDNAYKPARDHLEMIRSEME
jgi:hypothetical protein